MVKTCSRAYQVGTNNVIFSPEQYIKVVITMCSRNLAVYRCTVKVGYCEIEGTEFLARYRRNSLLPTPAVEEFSLTEP